MASVMSIPQTDTTLDSLGSISSAFVPSMESDGKSRFFDSSLGLVDSLVCLCLFVCNISVCAFVCFIGLPYLHIQMTCYYC